MPPSRGSVCDSAVAAAVRMMMMRKKRDLYLGIQGMWGRFVFKSCLSDSLSSDLLSVLKIVFLLF